VRDLRRNLERASLWADVVGGDAAREIRGLGYFDTIVVDPPRSGLATEVVEAIGAHVPRTVVYVSCDPATLARDAAALSASGLRLESIVPVDLFPQSFHVEAVATFRS
jgi:23S rRNA (uracil1939-C5)-methyltransferase